MAAGSSIPLNNVIKNSDVALAGGVIGMLLIMVVPLPEIILDLMIALSISIAVLILFVSLFTGSALEFSSFPSVLLIATLFRLSINIASTRLILLEGPGCWCCGIDHQCIWRICGRRKPDCWNHRLSDFGDH